MRISVIIPTLNEAENIQATLESTRKLGDVEIIVVDGGSEDGTLDLCGAADVVLTAPLGRASQQNAAAAVATGEVLLFLHADCRLAPGCLDAIRTACEASDCVGGCFCQRIDAVGWRYRALEWGQCVAGPLLANGVWRSRDLRQNGDLQAAGRISGFAVDGGFVFYETIAARGTFCALGSTDPCLCAALAATWCCATNRDQLDAGDTGTIGRFDPAELFYFVVCHIMHSLASITNHC